ncbi:MAG: radical SAM protein [Candidatus Omnitrophota bacterium]
MTKETIKSIHKNRKSFKLLKDYIKQKGLSRAFFKTLNYLKWQNVMHNYSTIIGIFDGRHSYKGPDFVQIDLTNNCNNDCIGCWCNSPLLEEKRLPVSIKRQTLKYEYVLELLNILHEMGTREVYFAGGGEPFMYPQLLDILAYAKKKNFICYLNTNFTLVNEEIIDRLIALEIDHLTVSIWAATPETYVCTHPNKNKDTFFKLTNNLKLLNSRKKDKPIIKIYNVISNLNFQEVDKMVDFAIETQSETMEFTVVDTIPDKTDKLLLAEKENKIIYEECMNIKKKIDENKLGNLKILGFEQFLRRISCEGAGCAQYDKGIIDHVPCYIGWTFARILADGNVNSCLKSHRFPVGNIYVNNFADIWNSSFQQKFRRHTLAFKKDDPFFKLIGNDPNARVGCYKSCDDLMRNINTHNRITSLTLLEWHFLQGIAMIIKIIRKIKQERFKICLINKRYILGDKEGINMRQFDDNLKIYLKNEEITESIGLNSSFKVLNTWHDSSKSKWQAKKSVLNKVRLIKQWLYLPITQFWDITLEDKKTLLINIEMDIEEEIEIEAQKVTLLLSGKYKKWFVGRENGLFSDFDNWEKLNLGGHKQQTIGVCAFNGLPDIEFRFFSDEFWPEVQNSDYKNACRIVSAVREGKYRLLKGRHKLFCGEIKIIKT